MPDYVVQACLDADRYELSIDSFGNITDRRPIGACDAPVDPNELGRLLADLGLDRAKVIDSRPPRYRLEACRGRNQVEIVVNRYGRILDEVQIGRCSPPVSADDLTTILSKQGYSNIYVTDNGEDGFVVTACTNNRRNELLLTRYGEVLKQRELGRCTSLTVSEVLKSLAKDGWQNTSAYVEGCRQGRRLRLQLNEFGEETGRERLGRC